LQIQTNELVVSSAKCGSLNKPSLGTLNFHSRHKCILLSDTEFAEYITQQVICSDLTGNISMVMKGLADVHGKQVSGYAI
jgi:hypothetical protein